MAETINKENWLTIKDLFYGAADHPPVPDLCQTQRNSTMLVAHAIWPTLLLLDSFSPQRTEAEKAIHFAFSIAEGQTSDPSGTRYLEKFSNLLFLGEDYGRTIGDQMYSADVRRMMNPQGEVLLSIWQLGQIITGLFPFRWKALCAARQAVILSVDKEQRPRARQKERLWQTNLVREIFANPFQPVPTINLDWLAWRGGAILALAQAIYDREDFSMMPILADALEETGCTDPAILNHCRQAELHVRGCWLLDLLLGKS
jgi:hypothetical protein